MSLWGKIKSAVRKVADAVEDFVNDVGDAVGDAVEAAGDAINDALNWLGDALGGKPFFSWLGGIVKGVLAVVGAVIKGTFGIIAGIVGGLIKIVGGIFTGQGGMIVEGLLDIVSPIIGTIVVVVGKVVALVQSVFYAQGFERPLTDGEKAELTRVFKTSLNYYVIRLVTGHSGLFGLSSRAFTLGNTIYMKTDSFPTDLLVHETTHVWQYQQTGDRYASDAIGAQWFLADAYDWRREIDVRGKDDWSDFNNEAQAEFLQDLWRLGAVKDSAGNILQTGNGVFYDADGVKTMGYFEVGGEDYTAIASAAIETVRDEWF